MSLLLVLLVTDSELFLSVSLALDSLGDIFFQVDSLLYGLRLLLGLVGDHRPCRTLILESQEVLSAHAANQALHGSTFNSCLIVLLFVEHVLITDDVTFLQTEKLKVCYRYKDLHIAESCVL